MTNGKALIVSNVYRKVSTLNTIKIHIEDDEEDFNVQLSFFNKQGENMNPFLFKDHFLSKEDCKYLLDGINKRLQEYEKRLEEL